MIVGYTNDAEKQTPVAFSTLSSFDARLPCGDDANASILHLLIVVRDTSDCVSERNMTTVIVSLDPSTVTELIDILDDPNASLTTNPVIQLLSSGNQNTVSQLLTSLSQQFNTINNDAINNATAGNY